MSKKNQKSDGALGVVKIDGQADVTHPSGRFSIPCYLHEGRPILPDLKLGLTAGKNGRIEVGEHLFMKHGYMVDPPEGSIPVILHGYANIERIERAPEHESGVLRKTTHVQNKDGSFREIPLVKGRLTYPAVVSTSNFYIAGVSIEGWLSGGEIEVGGDFSQSGYEGLEQFRRPGDRLVSVDATVIVHGVGFGYQDEEGVPGFDTLW